MQKFSSFGRKKKKQTKIRHRMVMLEGLQLYKGNISRSEFFWPYPPLGGKELNYQKV